MMMQAEGRGCVALWRVEHCRIDKVATDSLVFNSGAVKNLEPSSQTRTLRTFLVTSEISSTW